MKAYYGVGQIPGRPAYSLEVRGESVEGGRAAIAADADDDNVDVASFQAAAAAGLPTGIFGCQIS